MITKNNSTVKLFLAMAISFVVCYILFECILGLAGVSGPSMNNTYKDGQILVFQRNVEYDHGDVLIIHSSALGINIIKRVIGLPGDRIAMKDGVVYRNGEALEEPYAIFDATLQYPEITVPEGTVFVMGDNRPESRDSRDDQVGCINQNEVAGVVIGSRLPK